MTATARDYTVELDRTPGAGPGEEMFVVRRTEGAEERIRLHDYDRVYAIPGLYEEVVQEQLECSSPATVVAQLARATAADGREAGDVRVLDVGAGNGVVGETLRDAGFRVPVASDALVEARDAAERDRPGLYAEYVVDDGTVEAVGKIAGAIRRHELNALVCAGALGPGHLPLPRLVALWGLMPAGSYLALTAASELVAEWGGARRVLDAVSGDDAPTELVVAEAFRHRLLMDGRSVQYDAIVGRKPSAG